MKFKHILALATYEIVELEVNFSTILPIFFEHNDDLQAENYKQKKMDVEKYEIEDGQNAYSLLSLFQTSKIANYPRKVEHCITHLLKRCMEEAHNDNTLVSIGILVDDDDLWDKIINFIENV